MNVRLLRKIAKHISEEPKRFSMGDWIQRKIAPKDKAFVGSDVVEEQSFARCGTAACIAGWALLLSGSDEKRCGSYSGDANRLLGIEDVQGERLFYTSNWGKFRKRHNEAKTPGARARIAVQRIEHFIKTKGQE